MLLWDILGKKKAPTEVSAMEPGQWPWYPRKIPPPNQAGYENNKDSL